MYRVGSLAAVAITIAIASVPLAARDVERTADWTDASRTPRAQHGTILAQAQAKAKDEPKPAAGKNCRREAIWGFRRSVFCKPTGMCADREIKGYRTVCS